jgi:hypothetical protein
MEHKPIKPLSSYSIALGVTAVAFLAGITAGCLLAVHGGMTADQTVSDYLLPIAGNPVARPPVGRVLLNTALYPLLCFFFGFAIPGIVLIPAAVCARGFFLSYAIACFARVFGAADGTLFSLSLMGIPLLLSLPCLFWLSTHGLLSCRSLFGSGARKPIPPVRSREHALRFTVVLCVLAVSAAVEIFLCPLLATLSASML